MKDTGGIRSVGETMMCCPDPASGRKCSHSLALCCGTVAARTSQGGGYLQEKSQLTGQLPTITASSG